MKKHGQIAGDTWVQGICAHLLLATTTLFIALGLVMLASTSGYLGLGSEDLYVDLRRQLVWVAIGVVVAIICAVIDYRFWGKIAWWGYGIALVLLVVCLVPGIGREVNGAWRWIRLPGGLGFQPSEVAKLAVVAAVAVWLAQGERVARSFGRGFIVPLLIVALPCLLILMEPDLGGAALLGFSVLAVMYVSGTRWYYLGFIAVGAVAGLLLLAWHIPNRYERLVAFMDLDATKDGFGLQQWRALLAFGSGGPFGSGLGDGRQKLLYLPFAHTDFILPVLGEELGLVSTLLVILGFSIIATAGVAIAMHAPDRFGRLLGFGMVFLIISQAALNIGVTTACLPNKGLPLPFISYGGSNLVMCLAAVGVLYNLYLRGVGGKVAQVGAGSRARRARW